MRFQSEPERSRRLWLPRSKQEGVRSQQVQLEIIILSEVSQKRTNTIWCWRKADQTLKEINPAYSLEALLVELKLQYFDHLMQRTDSLEKTLMLGKMKRKKRRGQQRMRWLDGITNSMDMNVSKPQETVKDREAWHALVHVVANNQT